MRRAAPILALLAACQSPAGGALEVPFPVRAQTLPDTTTVGAGELELEVSAGGDPFDDLEVLTTGKLGLGPTTEGYVEAVPYTDPAAGGAGRGDVKLGVRHRLWDEGPDGAPAFALQLQTKLPTAEEGEGLGSGELDLELAALGTRSFERSWVWGGYQAGFLGEADGAGFDVAHTVALGGARRVDTRLGAFVETTWSTTPGLDEEAGTLTVGGVLDLGDGTLVDFGVSLGFGDDGEDGRVFVGLTRGLGRLLGG